MSSQIFWQCCFVWWEKMIPPFLFCLKSTDWFSCLLSGETAFIKHHIDSKGSINERWPLLFAGLVPGYRINFFVCIFSSLYFPLTSSFYLCLFFILAIKRSQVSLTFTFFAVALIDLAILQLAMLHFSLFFCLCLTLIILLLFSVALCHSLSPERKWKAGWRKMRGSREREYVLSLKKAKYLNCRRAKEGSRQIGWRNLWKKGRMASEKIIKISLGGMKVVEHFLTKE